MPWWARSQMTCLVCGCSVEVLRDWRAMVGALTSDQANEERGDAATTNLVLLLSASVHRAVSATPAGHRTDAK